MSVFKTNDTEATDLPAQPQRKCWSTPLVIVSKADQTDKIVFSQETTLPTQFGPS